MKQLALIFKYIRNYEVCIVYQCFFVYLQRGLSTGFRVNPEQGLHADAVARQQQGQMGPRARRTT